MDFQRLTNAQDIDDLIQWHNENSSYVVLDTETTDKDPKKAELLDVQLSGPNENSYIFVREYADKLLKLTPVLIAHHYPYDAHVLYRHGVDLLNHPWRDTLLLGHLIDENRDSYSLDSYVQENWHDDYKEVFWKKYKSYQEASEDDKVAYACKDIVYTQRLYESQQASLRAQSIPLLLCQLVHDLQRHLLQTQIQGIKVDLNYLLLKGVDLKTQIDRLRPEMRKEADIYCQMWEMQEYDKEINKKKKADARARVKQPRFSFDSSKQLQALLYEHLRLPIQRNEKTKSISTDEASLEKLRDSHPLIPKLLEYRGHQKIYTAFIEGTESRLQNGRIYPGFKVSGTATGRISHNNPNLGQLPKAGGIRGIYVPEPGYVLISADYSQLEVNIEANLTADPNLTKIFTQGLSKHDITATNLKITRAQAKTLNFALQYWASHFKVAKLLGVSLPEGQRIWNEYWRTYAGAKALKAETDRMVDCGEHLTTLFGRKRRFECRKRSPWDGDYRQAYNFLIQGTGADITSRAFILVCAKLAEEGWGRGLFTVHDELLIEVKKEYAKEAEAFMLRTMVSVGDEIGLKIPLKAESSGAMDRWLD